MTPDFASIASARTRVGLFHSAIDAALLDVTVLARMYTDQYSERLYELDVYSTRAPFLSPEWPRS
jgi:hypothetical protein